MFYESTICAVATPAGGALSIIRVTGPDTFKIVEKFIHFPLGKKKLIRLPANTVHFAHIKENEEIIDEVMISIFRAPHSYTGEDMIEISCHGSTYIQKRILEVLIHSGATLARPGEFTQRAFLNGKMDLSQAEAVADLIASESEAAHKIAMDYMRGGFSKEIMELRKKLINFVSLIELELDFSEEDVEFADRGELKKLVRKLLTIINRLTSSFHYGNVIKNGIPVAIIGKPNVGKSTLLNRLFNEEKAIVSEIEGTTRDVIEDTIVIEGITFRFIDTAGLRETADLVENLGIRKTYQKIEQAETVILLADAADDKEIIIKSVEHIRDQLKENNKHLILLINKTDLVKPEKKEQLRKELKLKKNEKAIFLSVRNDEDLSPLLSLLIKNAHISSPGEDDVIISNVRHYEALKKAAEALDRVVEGIENHLTQDLLAQDLRETLHHLGEITGEITTDEILGNIFRNFCIGK